MSYFTTITVASGTSAIGKLTANSGVTIGTVEIASAQTLGTVTTVSTVTNLSQLGGTAISMGTGVRSAGTQRVTIATDDVIGTVSTVTNLSQLGGTAIAMGTGVRSAGTQRVTIATDDVIGTVSTVTNLSQLGGTAIAMGTGVRSSGTQRVTIATDDVVPASQSGTWNVGLSAGTNGIGKLTANSGVIIGDVNIAASQSVAVTQATASSLNAQVVGNVASGATDSGNPIKIGGKGVSTTPTVVTAGQRVDSYLDRSGRQVVRTATQVQDTFWSKTSATTATTLPSTGTTATCNSAAAGSGIKNVCTSISATLASTSAPTAGTLILQLFDGSNAGTVLQSWVLSMQATAGANTGLTITDLWIPGTANTAMTLCFNAGLTNVYSVVSMTGITITE